jgi:hypothetical protein
LKIRPANTRKERGSFRALFAAIRDTFPLSSSMVWFFSSPARKEAKEAGIGEALRKCRNYGMIATGNHETF